MTYQNKESAGHHHHHRKRSFLMKWKVKVKIEDKLSDEYIYFNNVLHDTQVWNIFISNLGRKNESF